MCQLVAEGAHVAMCDVSADNMAETQALAGANNPHDVRITSHRCDVGVEADVLAFRDAVLTQHETDHVNLLFNNAGIGGGGEFVSGARDEWERTFAVCWYGVYYGCRAFMDALVASDEGHIINTSSVNGFWASIGPDVSHTAYSAAKFAVKGFTEALITDLRRNAPHIKCSVVMPGHIGTSIAINTGKVLGREEMTAEDVAQARARLEGRGVAVSNLPDDHIRELMRQQAEDFRDKAPTSAGQAAGIILDGVRAGRWRILVGDDAHALDATVRQYPEEAYEPDFALRIAESGHLQALIGEEAPAAQD